MNDNFDDVLNVLAKNDGACLYWQMPDVVRAKAAVAAGAAKEDGELLVHPKAVCVKPGESYVMPAGAGFSLHFPDYPAADMPTLPEGFEDTSWRNDAMPSYSNPHFQIWIDYVDPALREFEGKYPRFNVSPMRDGIEITGDSIQTDSWDEVLEFLEEQRVARLMSAGGYYILTDDSDKRATAYHVMQGDRRIHIAYSKLEATDFVEAHERKQVKP